MKSRGSIFSTLATLVERRGADLPAIGLVGNAHDRRHHRILAAQARTRPRPCRPRTPARVGLRREMARRALQIVGDRPVVFVSEPVLDERGDHRPDAAQLRVAERVLACRPRPSACRRRSAGLRKRRRSSSRTASRSHRRRARKRVLVEGDLRKQQHQRDRRRRVVGQADRGGDPARRGGPSPRARTPWSRSWPSTRRRTPPRASTSRRISPPSRSPGSCR